MASVSKKVAERQIAEFFQNPTFTAEQVRKIQRLAMSHNIKLGPYKKLFCQNCLIPLRGSLSISKTHKTIVCAGCKQKNKIKFAG
jgi:RNase P subunit RPR2